MVSLRDAADEADVSIAAVSHLTSATSDVSPDLTARVRRALEKRNSEPNLGAREVRAHRCWVIGLSTPGVTNLFHVAVESWLGPKVALSEADSIAY